MSKSTRTAVRSSAAAKAEEVATLDAMFATPVSESSDTASTVAAQRIARAKSIGSA